MLTLVTPDYTPEFAPQTEREQALLAYNREAGLPHNQQNWGPVAKALQRALVSVPAAQPSLPLPRRRRTGAPATAPRGVILADYPLGKARWDKLVWPSPKVTVTFADGEVVRAPAVSLAGKPANVGRGLRLACAFYQSRRKAKDGDGIDPFVPEIVCASLDGDPLQTIDPAAANAATVEARKQPEARDYGFRSLYDPRDYYLRLRRTLNPEWPAKKAWAEARKHR